MSEYGLVKQNWMHDNTHKLKISRIKILFAHTLVWWTKGLKQHPYQDKLISWNVLQLKEVCLTLILGC